MNIEICRVTDRKGLDTFIQLHYDLYRGSEYDAPNLYSDELTTLSRDKNPAFDFCEAEYFLAYKDGKVVGRVAAIINHRYNKQWNRPCVRWASPTWIPRACSPRASTSWAPWPPCTTTTTTPA